MNFDEIVQKKFLNASEDEDNESLASSTSDVSFTLNKKEVKIETSIISTKSDDDSLQELIRSIEKHDEIKLDESLKEKANEIFDYLKDSSESSNPTESDKIENKPLDQSQNDSDLKKIADNLDNSQLNESINESIPESENDSELKQVAKNLEAAMNDSLNDSSIEEPQSKEAEQSLNQTQSSEPEIIEVKESLEQTKASESLNDTQNSEPEIIDIKENLTQLVNEIIAPLSSIAENKIADEQVQQSETDNESEKSVSTTIEKTPDEPQSALSQIMQFVTGLATLNVADSSKNDENQSEQKDQSNAQEQPSELTQLPNIVSEIENELFNVRANIETQQAPQDLSNEIKLDDIVQEIQQVLETSQASEQLNTSSEEPVSEQQSSSKEAPSEESQPAAEDQSNQQSEHDASQQSISDELNTSSESQASEPQKSSDGEIKPTENASESQSESQQQTSEELNTSSDEPASKNDSQNPEPEPEQIEIKENVEEVKAKQEAEPVLVNRVETESEVKLTYLVDGQTIEAIGCKIFGEKSIETAQEPIEKHEEPVAVANQEATPVEEKEIIEKIASLAQELIEPIKEVVESVSCTLFSPDEILLRKDEIINKYKINEEQFELCRDFFNEKKEDSLLNNSLLRSLMKEALKTRTQVKANEQDVNRALEAVDENKDDKITFDEFIQLLLLFFSSKTNVENRVANILKAKLNSETLSANDALEFANFLNKFYGRDSNNEEFKEGLNVADFLKDISLSSLAFVQPEPEQTSTEQPASEQPVSEQPTNEQPPATEQPATEQKATEQSTEKKTEELPVETPVDN